ncbi:MAG: hypothetical protein M1831_001085 [Alyxoria varia]|nr:MAG: hypothetical protein M1831_001085 [Alyxoria varia]
MKYISMFTSAALGLLLMLGDAPLTDAAPSSSYKPWELPQNGTGSSFWMETIKRRGTVAYSKNPEFKIFRNVKQYGAKGDGIHDDTAAINKAVSDGMRCGKGCNSSTTDPALVYFPSGTYVVSKPIVQLYYTQFVGDPLNLPTIKGAAGFEGMALIDTDPYDDQGNNWWTNQNNFYRQIRNFVIDLTGMPESKGAGIHWQVAQATSLQNIVFNMKKGGSGNKQQGIFMDNGSGGFMTDLIFNGGNIGAFFGSQQFTTRNLTFNDCKTAVFMNWNWLWSLKSLNINNCGTGVDMANMPENQTVGSVILADSKFVNTKIGVNSSFTDSSIPETGGTLIIDNVDFKGAPTAVASHTGKTILAGGRVIDSWGQGRQYTGPRGTRIQGPLAASANKPAGLLDAGGKIFERAKPQYADVPASSFVSIKSKGAKGNGISDDTQAIQKAMDSLSKDQILYFDHGAYVVSDTVRVPKDIRMTGEMWPLIMAKGKAFQNKDKLVPVFQVGQQGDTGNVEMSDMVFETVGPQPGALLIEFNVAGSQPGAAGMWDVHTRVGGSAGTDLQQGKCTKQPSKIAPANPECIGAGMLIRITKDASAYLENVWAWVADHELDTRGNEQINIFNGRGILIESRKPTWLYGTASEHSTLYQYAVRGAKDLYMSAIQTESPYFQANPDALDPFQPQTNLGDPTYEGCKGPACKKSWGLIVEDSKDVLLYGGGLYSFFENWDQQCAGEANDCQTNMIRLDKEPSVRLYGVSTKAAVNMVTLADGTPLAFDRDNRSNFCGTVALVTAE